MNLCSYRPPEQRRKRYSFACVDGQKGFADAINSVFPETNVQLCIVHQIRNSLKYISSKDQKEFLSDLKLVYFAVSKEATDT